MPMRLPAWLREGEAPDRRAALVLLVALTGGLVLVAIGLAGIVYLVTLGLARALNLG